MFSQVIEVLNILILIYLTWSYISSIKGILSLILIAIIYIMFGLMATRKLSIIKVIRDKKVIMFLNILILFSNTFSITQPQTLELSIKFISVTIFSIFLCVIYKEDKFISVLSKYFILSILASLALIIVFPNKGMMLDDRFLAAQGIYGHKNILGRYMVISFFVLLNMSKRVKSKRKKIFYIIFSILSVFLIFISKSTTSILYLLGLTPLYLIIERKISLINIINKAIVVVGGLLGFFVYFSAKPEYYEFFSNISIGDRNLALTGRNVIWNFSLEKIAESHYIGYGFDAVWSNNDIINSFLFKYGFTVPHAHNGYLDTALQLGILGLVFMIIILINLLRFRNKDKLILPTIIIWFIIFINFTEAAFVEDTTYIFWILIVYFYGVNPKK